MSSTKRARPDDIDLIWHEHESTIRRLYEKERKTLEQVKHCMESEHGFPEIPRSTYESKLRDELKLRKKLKKDNWPVIYHHWRKRNGQETGIYLNGSRIPWKKAWKEIRRSGAHLSDEISNPDYDNPLPPEIEVRTPSPNITSLSSGRVILKRASLPRSLTPKLLEGAIATSIETGTSADRGSRFSALDQSGFSLPMLSSRLGSTACIDQPDVISNPTLSNNPLLELPPTFVKSLLEVLPWNVWKSKVRPIMGTYPGIQLTKVTEVEDSFLHSAEMDLLKVPGPSSPSLARHLEHSSTSPGVYRDQGPSLDAPAFHFDTYHSLTTTIYLLSNNHLNTFGPSREGEKVLDVLFSRLPRRVLLTFLDNDLPSIWAAWEALVSISKVNSRRDIFSLLMTIGLKKRDRIVPNGHIYLEYAASLDCPETLQKLLDIGACFRDEVEAGFTIESALAAGSWKCAQILIPYFTVHCITHRPYASERITDVFAHFLFEAIGSHRAEDAISDELLEMFLDAGADVDLISRYDPNSDMSQFHEQHRIPRKWHLSVLDRCLYKDSDLFKRLAPHSRLEFTKITRAGVCLAAKQGKTELERYLDSLSREDPRCRRSFLELVLSEQFYAQRFEIDTKTILSLVEIGVDICLPSLNLNISDLAYRLIVKARLYGLDHEITVIMNTLLNQETVLDIYAIEGAVAEKGLGILPALVDFQADFKKYGGLALATAARLNNLEAVSWLLDAKVDINAGINVGNEILTVIASATVGVRVSFAFEFPDWLRETRPPGFANIETIRYLMYRGAMLRYNGDEKDSFTFLKRTMYMTDGIKGVDDLQLDRVRLFLDSGVDLRDPAGSHAYLLEACFNSRCLDAFRCPSLDTFELLFRQGAPVSPGSPLALLIYHGGRHELVEEVLEAGADINSYSGSLGNDQRCYTSLQAAAIRGDQELVSTLLQKGADINQPACGYEGRTALQAICDRNAPRVGKNRQKGHRKNLISYLIGHGADVNAPAADKMGHTALQIVAQQGDIDLALLLLDRGANPNAPPAKLRKSTALDEAARMGCLDMVQLLLKVGALSYNQGRTGYAGAIEHAEEFGHAAVADLIRSHVRNRTEMREALPWLMDQEIEVQDWSDDRY